MPILKSSTFRQRGYVFSTGSVVMVYGDVDAPTVDPSTQVVETPRLEWDNTVIATTVTTSNLPTPPPLSSMEHGS